MREKILTAMGIMVVLVICDVEAVDRLVPSVYPTIQAGINAASDGDTVIVADGTYTDDGNRDLDFSNGLPPGQTRAIMVRSENGPENCIIDCQGTEGDPHRGFYFHSTEDANSIVYGFMITNGYGPDELVGSKGLSIGGAIMCIESSPTILNCVLSNNSAGYGGGAIFCMNYSSPIIKNCLIDKNHANRGGGISCVTNSTATITNCTITNCYGNGIRFSGGGGLKMTIRSCVITGNKSPMYGGGIYIESKNTSSIINNCIISGNEARYGGGGIFCNAASPKISNCTFNGNRALRDEGGAILCASSATPTITNCIFWNDFPDEIYYPSAEPSPLVSFCDVQGGWLGEGNTNVEPLFSRYGHWDPNGSPDDNSDDFWVDGDYHLCKCSELIDGGTNNPSDIIPETDIDGNPRPVDGDGDGNAIVDIGAFECPVDCEDTFIKVDQRELEIDISSLDVGELQYRTIQVWNCGIGELSWEIVEDCNWLTAIPPSGSLSGEIDDVTLIIDSNGLDIGKYRHTLMVCATDIVNAPIAVEVILHIGAVLRVPQNYQTIQAAIDDSDNGDIVLVADGVYTGDGNRSIDFKGKAITVRSENGPSYCIIHPNYESSGFNIHRGEGLDSVVSGFTVRNARSGFRIVGSSPKISNCIIKDNKGHSAASGIFLGAGVYIGGNSLRGDGPTKPIIENCFITDNVVIGGEGKNGQFSRGNAYGAGVYVAHDEATAILKNCFISNNKCIGGNRRLAGPPFYWVSSAYGAGVYVIGTGGLIISNCTITNNWLYPGYDISGDKVGEALGAGINCQYNNNVRIKNSIIWNNRAYDYNRSNYTNSEIYGSPFVTYTNVMNGYDGIGNIDEHPDFVYAINGRYRLSEDSPCINAGDPNFVGEPNEIDLVGLPRVIGGRVDMGACEFQAPPDCSGAYPSIGEIWPPNHKWVEVDILGVTDPEGGPIVITITGITQNEPVVGQGSGHTCPDGDGIGTSFARVRAERSGQGNGRVYEISFEAHDSLGGVCDGTVQVCVPYDEGEGCIDDGQIYDSTASELLRADLNSDGSIDNLDLVILMEHWLEDKASVNIVHTGGDNILNFRDWAALARYWFTYYELDY